MIFSLYKLLADASIRRIRTICLSIRRPSSLVRVTSVVGPESNLCNLKSLMENLLEALVLMHLINLWENILGYRSLIGISIKNLTLNQVMRRKENYVPQCIDEKV